MDMSATLAELAKAFELRMAAYEERLHRATGSLSSPDVVGLSREFTDFKTFVWDTLSTLKKQVELLSLGMDRQETYHRRKVLLLHGIPESKDEKPHLVVARILSDQMKLTEVTPDDLEACHRLGSNTSKPRPILLRFNMVQQRQVVWDSKSSLKGSGCTLSEFLTRPRHQVFMAARKHFGMNRCWSAEGRVNVLLPDKSRRRLEQMSELEVLIAQFPGQPADSQGTSGPEKTSQGAPKIPTPAAKPIPKSVRTTRNKQV